MSSDGMMDQRMFGGLVSGVLPHLYDLPYLQTHSLGRLLVPEASNAPRGRALQRVLLDTIQALKPSADAGNNPHAWRTYRYLFLRYIQVHPPVEVARELGISERQARRTYREAIDALSSLLWDEYCAPRQHVLDQAAVEEAHPDDMPSEQANTFLIAGRASSGSGGELVEVSAFTSSPLPAGSVLEQEVLHLAASRHEGATDLPDLIAGLAVILDALAGQHGCTWLATLDPMLPHLDADRAVVRQLLLNVCAMFFERGSGELQISATPGPGNVDVTLRFRPTTADTGVRDDGSPPCRDIAAIDEVHNSRLLVGRRLVETVGGSIAFHLSPDGVTSVVVSLRSTLRATILVIDDNPDIVAVFRRYLESAGLEVFEADNGADGFRIARGSRPAAITLDVMMASQDGWETLQLLKNHPETHEIPVLICSVLREHELARFLGATELLPKPVARPVLLAALARCGLPVAIEERRSNS
jgi:CheY-like chemotaxis protein